MVLNSRTLGLTMQANIFPNTVKEFCNNNGMHLKPSPEYAPQTNSCAERLIQEHWAHA